MATNTLRMILKLRVIIKLETNKEPSRYYVNHFSGERGQYVWLRVITGLITNDSYFPGVWGVETIITMSNQSFYDC